LTKIFNSVSQTMCDNKNNNLGIQLIWAQCLNIMCQRIICQKKEIDSKNIITKDFDILVKLLESRKYKLILISNYAYYNNSICDYYNHSIGA
jgi:hypothetical protein